VGVGLCAVFRVAYCAVFLKHVAISDAHVVFKH